MDREARLAEMVRMRKEGTFLDDIGAHWGISGERVRQIFAEHAPELAPRRKRVVDEAWLDRVVALGPLAVAREEGCSRDTVSRYFTEARGMSPKQYRMQAMEALAPTAVAVRNTGSSWREVQDWWLEQLPWLAKQWGNGIPGHAARSWTVTWAKKDGVHVRMAASHDPGRPARALALREQGLPLSEVAKRSGYANASTASAAIADARRARDSGG